MFISDEVQTGWGRTGENFWGYQAHGMVPDMMTFAKGVGNGLALGGVVARAEVMEAMPANSISTFGGNPIASAGALATIKYMLEHDTQNNSKEMGNRLIEGISKAVEDSPVIAEIRGRGLMVAIETVVPDSIEPNADAAAQLMEAARASGLLIGKGGLYGNVIRIAPPMTVTAEEIDEGIAILNEAIKGLHY